MPKALNVGSLYFRFTGTFLRPSNTLEGTGSKFLVNNCSMYCSFLNLLIRMHNPIVLGDLNFS